MSLVETQNFLARIYTDENLRRAFLRAPEQIGREHDLTGAEIAEIIEIFPSEIKTFAETLFYKRLRETEKLLPLTRQNLGAEFEKVFRQFANTFNPQTIKKHLEDAFRFADYLQNCRTVSDLAKNTAKFERAKLEFWTVRKNLVVKLFAFDAETGARKKHLKIWLRIGGREMVF